MEHPAEPESYSSEDNEEDKESKYVRLVMDALTCVNRPYTEAGTRVLAELQRQAENLVGHIDMERCGVMLYAKGVDIETRRHLTERCGIMIRRHKLSIIRRNSIECRHGPAKALRDMEDGQCAQKFVQLLVGDKALSYEEKLGRCDSEFECREMAGALIEELQKQKKMSETVELECQSALKLFEDRCSSAFKRRRLQHP